MFSTNAAAVHPHGCGEHSNQYQAYRTGRGSSPRVWGTLIYGSSGIDIKRFIPTGVGNTAEFCVQVAVGAVHPHGCGEHMDT